MDKIKACQFADLAYYSRFKPPVRTITFAAPSETLTNFPCLVKCNSTFNIGTSTGYDVHFQDLSGNELYFDLDYYDSVTGNGAWWVRVPSLTSSGPTSIKMLYGDSSASTNGSSPSTVWADYAYVYHFTDIDNLASVIGSYTMQDTSTGGITATLSLVSNSYTGLGMSFYCTVGYSNAFRLAIANAISGTTGTITMFASTNVIGRSDRYFQFNTGWTKFQYQLGGTTFTTVAGNASNSLTRSQAGTNYCYSGSTGSTAVGHVVNGEILDTSSATKGTIRWDSPSMQMTGYNASQPTELTIDELRISTTTYKSAEWLQYEQKQLIDHSNYVTYGPEA